MDKFQVLKFDKRFKSCFRALWCTSCFSVCDEHVLNYVVKYCFKDVYPSGESFYLPMLGVKFMINGKTIRHFRSDFSPVYFPDTVTAVNV